MPLTTTHGSLKERSTRDTPPNLHPEVNLDNTYVSDRLVSEESGITNSFANRNVVDDDLYSNDSSGLVAYAAGSILQVTYFKQCNALNNDRTINIDQMTNVKDEIHNAYICIRNFEIRTTSFDTEFSQDDNLWNITGEGTILAGFEPMVNDEFLYRLREGMIGVFVLTDVTRTAIATDVYYKIKFNIKTKLTKLEDINKTHQIVQTLFYDKNLFHTTHIAILSSESLVQKQDLIKLRTEIVNYLIINYFDKTYNSFLRPDKIYDPYAVEYSLDKLSYNDGVRPLQLGHMCNAYGETFWSLLTSNKGFAFRHIRHKWGVTRYRNFHLDSSLSALTGQLILAVGSDIPILEKRNGELKHIYQGTVGAIPAIPKGDFYALGEPFYGNSYEVSPIRRHILDIIFKQDLNIPQVLTDLDEYYLWDLDSNDTFYDLLLSLHVIDYSIYTVSNRKSLNA